MTDLKSLCLGYGHCLARRFTDACEVGRSQVLKKRGRGGEAIALYTQAQEIYERLHGCEAPQVAGCLNNIASVFTDQVPHGLATARCDCPLLQLESDQRSPSYLHADPHSINFSRQARCRARRKFLQRSNMKQTGCRFTQQTEPTLTQTSDSRA
jgi:hypothetical protein